MTRPPVARHQRFDRVAICLLGAKRPSAGDANKRNLWTHAPDQYKATPAKAGVAIRIERR